MSKKDSTVIFDEEETSVSRVAVRISAFWPDDPELWFAQTEGQFTLPGVKDDDTKYSYVLSKLEPKQAREVRDVITHPPPRTSIRL